MKSRPVIIIRGCPGFGKTTTSILLREKLKPAARLSIDTIRYFVVPREFKPEQFLVAQINAARMAVGYAEVGIASIIEDVFDDVQVLEEMRGIVESAGISVYIFTLYVSLECAFTRNFQRDIYYHQRPERIRELYESYDWSIGKLIHSENKIVEEVVEDILNHVENS
ncbi:MAG: AAA family ATPase [Rhizonema sp. PD38]|nr:AAA family ATPase [Rhizonema sp. PD38]